MLFHPLLVHHRVIRDAHSSSISGHIGSNHAFISFSGSIPSSPREKPEKASHILLTSFSTSCCKVSKRSVNGLQPLARSVVILSRLRPVLGDSTSGKSPPTFADL